MSLTFRIITLSLFANLNFVVADSLVFEDPKFRNEVLPFIQESMDSPADSIYILETNQGKAIVSIVATPNILLKSNPTPKDKLDMFTITLNKGKTAISKFLKTNVASETEITTSSQTDYVRDERGLVSKAYQRNTEVDERLLEQSSMVMVNSKAIAHWFTLDNQFFKRAVVFIPTSK